MRKEEIISLPENLEAYSDINFIEYFGNEQK